MLETRRQIHHQQIERAKARPPDQILYRREVPKLTLRWDVEGFWVRAVERKDHRSLSLQRIIGDQANSKWTAGGFKPPLGLGQTHARQSQHRSDTGRVEVPVNDADFAALEREGSRDIRNNGAFAGSTFGAGERDDGF